MVSAHVLDHPAWNSLTTYHARFAVGTDLAKRYPADIGIFGGIADHSEAALRDLAQIVAPGETVIINGVAPGDDLPGWTEVSLVVFNQMICEQAPDVPNSPETILEMGAADVPDILHLVELTRPGAFFQRTIELGRFIGLRHDGQLIALAGERYHVPGYHEISAVCTHPDFQGRGYARLLVSELVAGHQRRGEISFLSVFVENIRAFSVYEKLGFRTRVERQVPLIQRKTSKD